MGDMFMSILRPDQLFIIIEGFLITSSNTPKTFLKGVEAAF
jgi:hypothetical protein